MRLASLLAATALTPAALLAPAAHFNTNAGSTLWICTTAQQADLDAPGFAALMWVQIRGVGSHGEVGTTTNVLTYDTWDTTVDQKAKGRSNAGDPVVELSRNPTDPGQMALRAAALTNLNYAFKIVRNDKPDANGTPTIIYNRGMVVGPRRPMGRNEDFDLEQFTLALNQRETVVDPTA